MVGNSKISVVTGIVVGVLFGFSLVFGIIYASGVYTYIENTKEIVNLYDFYNINVGDNTNAVYFVGSSIVGCSIDPIQINQHLEELGYENITAYNLAINGDTPLQRSVQIQNIIDSSPSLVVFGITYRSLVSNDWNSENIVLIHDNLMIRDDSLYLYSPEQLASFKEKPDINFYKKFILSALTYSKSNTSRTMDYTTDHYGINMRLNFDKQKDERQIIADTENPNNVWHPILTDESTCSKEALKYNINTLKDAGISVIVVNLPMHPLTSGEISNESRDNMHSFLSSLDVTWYDMELNYDDKYFWDNHHMNYKGSLAFAPVMADLIIQELS